MLVKPRPLVGVPRFVGREREMAALRAQVDAACAGVGAHALVVGPPGIGKTRTAEELAAYAESRGAQIFWGRCHEGDEGAPPFWPWAQIVRAYARLHDVGTLLAEVGPTAADIAATIPELRGHLPDLAPPPSLGLEQARFRFFDGITSLLRAAAARRPLVIILDDLHWADRPSLQLLQFLAIEVQRTQFLLVGTCRDGKLARSHALTQALAELARIQGSQRITLPGLTMEEVARFLEACTGITSSEALVATIHQETEGNPFFVAEIIRVLARDGQIDQGDVAGFLSVSIPESVRDVILRRVSPLSEACVRALTVAAVIGREFSFAVLERAAGLSVDQLVDALDEAEAAQVIAGSARGPGCYSFCHALIRATLYEELSATRRMLLHRDVSNALEGLCRVGSAQELAELAYHFVQASPIGNADKALAYARRAGDHLLRALAHEQAAQHYHRALDMLSLVGPDDERLRCELLLSLGEACNGTDINRATRVFQEAAELAARLGEPEMLARAALGLRVEIGKLLDHAHVRLLEQALAALGERDHPQRARLLAHLAIAHPTHSRERAEALSQQAVAIAERVGDKSALLTALKARWWALAGPRHVDQRLAVASEILRLAQETGDKDGAAEAHRYRIAALLELNAIQAVDFEIEAYAQVAQELRQPYHLWRAAFPRAARALMEGRLEEGEQLAEEAAAIGRRAGREYSAEYLVLQLLPVRREQGRLPEMAEPLTYFARHRSLPGWPCARAWLYSELGRKLEARQELVQLAADDFAALRADWTNWLANAALLSQVCCLLGDARCAAALYEQLRPYGDHNVFFGHGTVCFGSAWRYLGLLATTMARWDEAATHFERAIEHNVRIGARPWLAYTRHDFAAMLLQRGDPGIYELALGLAQQALDLAGGLRMARLAEQASSLRARCEALIGAGKEHPTTACPGGLTMREVEVLRLLAQGETNSEIAEELVLSTHTVARHISNIYVKIDAHGRADATAFALRHGLA